MPPRAAPRDLPRNPTFGNFADLFDLGFTTFLVDIYQGTPAGMTEGAHLTGLPADLSAATYKRV